MPSFFFVKNRRTHLEIVFPLILSGICCKETNQLVFVFSLHVLNGRTYVQITAIIFDSLTASLRKPHHTRDVLARIGRYLCPMIFFSDCWDDASFSLSPDILIIGRCVRDRLYMTIIYVTFLALNLNHYN
jgi:hypothetical protein